LPVIALTRRADVTSFDAGALVSTVKRAVSGRLPAADLVELMGPGPEVQRIAEQVAQVAPSRFTVLIQGETGTGKELVAQAVHQASSRCEQPFIAVDCGAAPESLIEAELFGHEKGAFTGAERRRTGFLRLADGGTLFLDEVANLPPSTQAKLLRVLQERQVQPLGSDRQVTVDVRFIAACNQPLPAQVKAGRFRQDLYFRLAEFTIQLPPLRQRRDDLPHLARRFLDEATGELKRPPAVFSPEALRRLGAHSWPGNVRELRNLVRQAALAANRPEIPVEAVERLLRQAAPPERTLAPGRSLREIKDDATAEAERQAIVEALRACQGNKSEVARRLQIDYKNLHLKMKRYGLDPKDYKG
jgi:two-component system nitrogen regulation response regulator GlnG